MRTEQLTKCFEPLHKLGLRETGQSPPPPYQDGTSDVVLYVACFGVGSCALDDLGLGS